MPLTENIGKNIKELRKANKSRSDKRSKRQILAIALEAAKRKK